MTVFRDFLDLLAEHPFACLFTFIAVGLLLEWTCTGIALIIGAIKK